jgi:hypothetical protein
LWGLAVTRRIVVSAGGSSRVFRRTLAEFGFRRSASWKIATL